MAVPKRKTSKSKKASKTNSSTSLVASKADAPASVNSGAETKKTDRDLQKRMARLKNQNSKQEEPKPTESEPSRASNKESATLSDNETTKTPPPATMPARADLNSAQRALLDRAAAEYRRATRQEFQALMAKGRAIGKSQGQVFALPPGSARRNNRTMQRFKFLGEHHPDVPTTAVTPQKKSPEPFNQEMRKAVW